MTKPVIIVGKHTIAQLQAGHEVELDVAMLLPASDLAYPAPADTAIATCEGCGKLIQEGDAYLPGPETDLCAGCAPTFQALLDEPEGFVSPDGDPLTVEQCRSWFDKHIAAGGKASDSMAVTRPSAEATCDKCGGTGMYGPHAIPCPSGCTPSPQTQLLGWQPPQACDGKEQLAFEAWAASKHYDMHEHPLHYIFMDPKTDAARMGWNAALQYVRDQFATTEGQP